MKAIFKREFREYFHSLIGYIFVAVYLFFGGILVSSYNVLSLSSNAAYALSDMTVIVALLVPAVIIVKLSERRKSNGDGLLALLHVSERDIALGRFFALLGLYAVPTAVFALFPMLLGFFAKINYISAYGAFLGFVLFGLALTSVCYFISCIISRSAVYAAVCYGTLVVLYLANIVSVLLPNGSVAAEAIGYLSLFGGLDKFVYGIFDVKAIAYYLATSALFILLSVSVAGKKANAGVSDKKRYAPVAGLLVAVMLFVSIGMSLLPVIYTEADVTGTGKYRVSSTTKKFLGGIDETVTIYVLGADGSNPQLESFLRRYADTGSTVEVEYVKSADEKALVESYGFSAASMSPYSLLICSDKRAEFVDFYLMYYYVNEKLGITSMSYSDYQYYYSLFSSNESYATYLEALLYDTELYFYGDAVITEVVEYVTLDIIPHTYLITGRGEDSVSEGNLAYRLGQMYYDFEPHNITESTRIPEDACCIVINAPKTDYTDAETKIILDYLKSGGRLLLITGEENLGMKNLSSITEYYGATAMDGLICEKPEGSTEGGEETDVYSIIPVLNDSHDILASFTYTPSVKNANAIEISDELRRAHLVTPLLTTSDRAYVGDETACAVYNLGVAIEEETDGGTTRLVWVTGAESFNGESALQGNLALLVYSLDWMDESYTSSIGEIKGVRFSEEMLDISSAMALGIGGTIVLISPASVIVYGVAITSKRRKA